jgi:hypothetical protein
MAKKIKEQVDLSDMFYDGVHDDASKAKVMRSPLWPLAVAVYAYFKPLRLGPVCHSGNEGELFHFLTESGLPVVCLNRGTDGDIRVMTADRGVHGWAVDKTLPYTSVLKSNNIRYVIAKLKPNAHHDVKDCLHRAIEKARVAMSEFMSKALDDVVDNLANSRMSKPQVEMPSHLPAVLMRIVIEGKSKDSIAPSQLRELTTAYSDYMAMNDRFEAAVNRGADMFNGDKWVAMNRVLGGVIVGAVSSKPLLAAYDIYKEKGGFPSSSSHNYIEPVVPFKWYKNIESMPQDIRSEFELSAVMLRAHTNSTGILPDIRENNGNMVVWEPVEAFGFSSWATNSADFIMFNK